MAEPLVIEGKIQINEGENCGGPDWFFADVDLPSDKYLWIQLLDHFMPERPIQFDEKFKTRTVGSPYYLTLPGKYRITIERIE